MHFCRQQETCHSLLHQKLLVSKAIYVYLYINCMCSFSYGVSGICILLLSCCLWEILSRVQKRRKKRDLLCEDTQNILLKRIKMKIKSFPMEKNESKHFSRKAPCTMEHKGVYLHTGQSTLLTFFWLLSAATMTLLRATFGKFTRWEILVIPNKLKIAFAMKGLD